ncbi:serine/threonine protein kinase [Nocardioides panacisoli]|uniref:serine/threonine-protein kinase n=1 Tax=Nocardioides panacisoli TaxID=627624 RepID=UPI001C630FA4|nr:serine/threonine-protein kinase [Nocardioides panacisoli]QYJ04493.1 serine/threonine protein kinase [Nocardioides panacisoli]
MTTQPSEPLVVGDYTVQTRLGEGGMGIVHLARHHDGRRVALKLLRPHVVGDEEARHRFAREIRSLERVRSPWVAEILDADPWGEVPYVVTRYVPGLSLHDHVGKEGPVEGPDLLWFAGCLAEGIGAVHAAGVLHRDVKPSNVLMEGRTPILIDFGLARVADDSRLTQTGWLLGTPGYLAPEILHGDTPTPAADVHAWAATVAWAATGHNPFGRGPSMAVMDRTRRGDHDLTGMSGPLADVVAAALDPDPLARPILRELLAWLRPLSTQPERAPVPPPVDTATDDDFTLPLAIAAAGSPVPPTAVEDPPPRTRVLSGPGAWPPPPPGARPVPTSVEPPGESGRELGADAVAEWERDWDERALAPARIGVAERARRAVLLVLAAVVVGAGVAAAPYVTAVAVAATVWLVRSASLTASAAMELRTLRGPKWYDAPRGLLTTPWHLLRGTVGTAALVLWSAGLGVAAGVVGAVLGFDPTLTLFAAGTVAAVALWPGPGALRLRNPLSRVVRPVARRPVGCAIGCGVLALAAGALGALSAVGGTSWFPAAGAPFGLG